MGFHRSSHAVWDCRYHLVWSTKYRKRAMVHEHEREECKKLLRDTAEQHGMILDVLEVDVDHVHLYIEVPPQLSVGKAVGLLKGYSARFMFERFPYLKQKLWAGHLWEASYFARTVGDGVTGEMVKRYIEHHSEKAQSPVQAELFSKRQLRKKPER